VSRVADLHIHTYFSDSSFSPDDVVREATRRTLACIAITDHDSLEGIAPALKAAADKDLEILPGVELSCEWQNRDIHVLGYLFDVENNFFNRQLIKFCEARIDRIYKMVDKLKKEGVDNITPEEVLELAESDAVGRPHLASLLVKKGWVSNIREAFARYLSEDRPAYVAKFKQTPYDAVDLIHQAGGIAVLAHPAVTNIDELIPGFVDAGLDGLEVYYPQTSSHGIKYYEGMASRYRILMTGGSDAHGEDRGHASIGDIRIPYELIEAMKKRAERYR